MKPAIRVENLSKRFTLGARKGEGYSTLRESLMGGPRAVLKRLGYLAGRNAADAPASETLWALKDVSFDIQPGEVVGIIGRNGAGKSTLLKILSRIIEPSSGRAELRGRIGSLLEVGTGFHPELTGRENIYLNGSVLGMSRQEINRRFDEIVAFAEMERFLDTAVKRYSTGMYVRLAFAVAAHLELEILFVDEVLAVGDLEFQKKCLNKMGSLAQGGRTVIFVSHNLGIIHRLCNRALILAEGRIRAIGFADQVIQTYLCEGADSDGKWERKKPHKRNQNVWLNKIKTLSKDATPTGIVACGEPFDVLVEYEVSEAVPMFAVGLQVTNSQGVCVFTTLDSDSPKWLGRVRLPGVYESVCQIPAHLLAPGSYSLTVGLAIINQQTLDTVQDALTFEVAETGCIRTKLNDRRVGVITPIFEWRIAGPV